MAKYDTARLFSIALQSAVTWWSAAKIEFGSMIGDIPEIKMNARLTSTAGRAFLQQGYIDLSCYLMTNNTDYFLKDTIPHELAHIIAWRLYGDKGHGKGWKYVALKLYGENNRCHSMKTKSQAERK